MPSWDFERTLRFAAFGFSLGPVIGVLYYFNYFLLYASLILIKYCREMESFPGVSVPATACVASFR